MYISHVIRVIVLKNYEVVVVVVVVVQYPHRDCHFCRVPVRVANIVVRGNITSLVSVRWFLLSQRYSSMTTYQYSFAVTGRLE